MRRIAMSVMCLCAALAGIALTGCVNCYTRCPGTHARVEDAYQSTRTAAMASVICAFPQIMSDCPGDYRLLPLNLLTVPMGVVALADTVCEAAVDTVCLPADFAIAKCRESEGGEEKEEGQ